MDLEPRHPQGHGHIRDGMSLGEHVFDLFAAVQEPVRHLCVHHGLFHFRFQSATFPDAFHGRKRQLGFHTLVDQIVHDIVTAADAFAQRCGSGSDDLLRVAKPYVRSVAQAGNAQQFLHCMRLGLFQHAPDKSRTELRHAVGSGIAQDFLRRHTQRLR